MTTVRSILFDMDGVLYSYDFENRLKLIETATNVPAPIVRAAIFESDFEESADRGEMTLDDYIRGISDVLGVDVTLKQWVAARKWAMAPDPMMIDLARQLGETLDIAMLTNNGPMMAEYIGEIAPELPALFGDRLFVSATSKCSKNFPESFTKLLGMLGWEASSTLFVDDDTRYIAAADAAGLITHRFTGINAFKAALAELGLPV